MSGSKCVRNVTITNPQGMHARPADMFVKLANRFASNIVIVKGSERVDGKSILGLLTLAATEGTELSLEADGPDAEAALTALAELVAQNFAEDEPTRQ
jgi:phosphotransferase system HPr (HPr) family protein